MANRKQVQKKITHKGGAINSVERAVERMNAKNVLEYAKKVNAKRRIKVLKKDTHTGETIVEIIEPSKIKSKTA
jgi:hypothetical protein